MQNKKGFSQITLLLLFGTIGLTGLVGWSAWKLTHQPHTLNRVITENPRIDMAKINELLTSAQIKKFDAWHTASLCGPTDGFEGYEITHSGMNISPEQSLALKGRAKTDGYLINNYDKKYDSSGYSYSIKSRTWNIQVVYYDGTIHIYPSIPIKEVLEDLPRPQSLCG